MDLTNYPFISDPVYSRAIAPSLTKHMTLRQACRDYADAGGVAWDKVEVAELSCAVSDGQITCLNRIPCNVGLPTNDKCILFEVSEVGNIVTLIDVVVENLASTVSAGTPWCIRRTVPYTKIGNVWKSHIGYIDKEHSDMLNKIQSCGFDPLTVSTAQAAVEASKYGSSCGYNKVYLYPHNATRSNGLLGTLADNEALDMAADEEDNVPDIESRAWKDEYVGFVCAGHTSHSTEAGRMRRVTADTSVRIISNDTLASLDSLRMSVMNDTAEVVRGVRDWTVFFMGKYCKATVQEVRSVVLNNSLQSLTDMCMYSAYVNAHSRVLVIHCSSGTLTKLCSNKVWADSAEVYSSHKPPGFKTMTIDTTGEDSVRACFSAYFSLWQYIKSNRPPRPLIGSVQTPQAHCLPWCPGTAAVSPCYTFDPLLTTDMYAKVMKDQRDGTANIATYLPGENVGVLYLNTEHNYEDAIMVSQRYIDNGGFCSISIVPYLISQSEYVPPVGSSLCNILSPWWKSPCPSWCTHQIPKEGARRIVSASSKGASGTVQEVEKTLQGDISVKVKSFQCLQQGDKLSTPHGQKGIVVKDILPPESLPMVLTGDGFKIFPDVVVAMSSIVTRQTNGQLYEAAKSLELLATSARIPCIVGANERCDVSRDFTVLSGETGRPWITHFKNDDGTTSRQVAAVSFGYTRMFAQTQMSRERHHVSHISPGSRSLRTTTGRSRGGGVAWGEMDIQASVAAGLVHCNAEITSRGSVIVFPICVQCKRLAPSCLRNDGCRHVGTAIAYDQVVFAIVTRIVYGYDILYDVEIPN
jgi:hypothetical protein